MNYFYLVLYSILFLSSYNLILGGISVYIDVMIQVIVTVLIFSSYSIIKQILKWKKGKYDAYPKNVYPNP